MKKSYQTKRELLIDMLFEKINWYEILKNHWQICEEWGETPVFINAILENAPVIKKAWLNNQNASLPTILVSLDVIPIQAFSKSKKLLLNQDYSWVCEQLWDLLRVAKISTKDEVICQPQVNIFGFKKSNPKYMLVSKMNFLEELIYLPKC